MLLISVLCFALGVVAPSDAVPVSIPAADGHSLYAEYYPGDEGAPAVLLLHQLYTDRTSWEAVVPALQAHGYHVLTPDLRGYGQTQGAINWLLAQDDTQAWLRWLAAQPGVRGGAVWTMGSSMGANLALIGCADFAACRGSVVLSPGRNYFGYTPLQPALDTLEGRPVLMISSRRDGYPARAVTELPPQAPGPVDVIWLEGNAHGVDLLDAALIDQIVGWLGR